METWIDFARGPLFRFCFALLVLGLLRLLYLAAAGILEACRRRPDKRVPATTFCVRTVRSLFGFRTLRQHPLQGVISGLFHVGLLMVTLFLAAHVLLWKRGVGFAWPALPEAATRWAALVVIVTGVALFAARAGSRRYREQNSPQELFWPPLILAPCITGYICSNFPLSPAAYQWLFLFHALTANLVMAVIPFTKVAQAVLGPLSRFAAHIHLESSEAGGGRRLVWVLHTPEQEEEVPVASGRREE